VELGEVVDFFRQPEKFRASGARAPKGVLLVGPPGNGKTLMARAVAGESGVAFISSSASEFIEMYMGLGAARVRDLFATARKCVRPAPPPAASMPRPFSLTAAFLTSPPKPK